jgi:transcriptional regulator of acetoin/glycerol metabolism
VEGVSDGALRALMEYDWPGNARELRNVIERAMVVAKDTRITEADISLPAPRKEGTNGKSLGEIEKDHILRILVENRWNIIRSAQVLGIDRVTLYNKIKKYELKKEVGA